MCVLIRYPWVPAYTQAAFRRESAAPRMTVDPVTSVKVSANSTKFRDQPIEVSFIGILGNLSHILAQLRVLENHVPANPTPCSQLPEP
jgi:hypothetical protein